MRWWGRRRGEGPEPQAPAPGPALVVVEAAPGEQALREQYLQVSMRVLELTDQMAAMREQHEQRERELAAQITVTREQGEQVALRVLEQYERMAAGLTAAMSDQADPDVLDVYYGMDALTCRIRRQAENLLVLSGHCPPDPDRQVTSLRDLIHAGVGRVERWQSITVGYVDHIAVAEAVSGDLIRVLTELLDNATRCTPPGYPITVAGYQLHDGGVLIRVEDAGFGMHEADLARFNWLLRSSRPAAAATVVGDVRLGLRVVAHAVAGHGVTVSLCQRAPLGTTAKVFVPDEFVIGVPGAGATPTGHRTWPTAELHALGPATDTGRRLSTNDQHRPAPGGPTTAVSDAAPPAVPGGLPRRDPQSVRSSHPMPAARTGPAAFTGLDDLAAFDAELDRTAPDREGHGR